MLKLTRGKKIPSKNNNLCKRKLIKKTILNWSDLGFFTCKLILYSREKITPNGTG